MIITILSIVCQQDNGNCQWDASSPAGTISPSIIDTSIQANNDAVDLLLQDYNEGVEVLANSDTSITVKAGQIVCSNAAGTIRFMCSNTSDITGIWTMIDTGAEANSTQYYVWAISDGSADTYTIKFSTSSTAPTGSTYFALIGEFYNNASGNIEQVKSYKLTYDSDDVVGDTEIIDWFAVSVATEYTKSFTLDGIPQEIDVQWASSATPTTVYKVDYNDGDVYSCGISATDSSVKIKSSTYFGFCAVDGTYMTSGYLKIILRYREED